MPLPDELPRIDELTLRLADGKLSPVEEGELQAFLEGDAAARKRHCELLTLEGALRGTGRVPDVVQGTVEAIGGLTAADVERTVMRTIAALPSPAWRSKNDTPPRSRFAKRPLALMGLAALASAALIAVLMGWGQGLVQEDRFATCLVVHVNGNVSRFSENESNPAIVAVGQRLLIDQALRLAEDESLTLQYDDGTKLEFFGPAKLRIERSATGGKQVHLAEGNMRADVEPQPADRPLWVVTPHTSVRVVGTSFEIVAGSDATRLDLEQGRVELVRSEEAPVAVEPGSIAVVASGSEPITIEQRPRMLTAHEREISFPGLEHGRFDEDSLGIVGLTRWQAVYVEPAGRIDAFPLSKSQRKGVRRESQSGPIVAFAEEHTRRTVLWNLADRREVAALEWSSLRREDETPQRVEAMAVSPRGDWLAVRHPGQPLEEIELHRLDRLDAIWNLRGEQKISSVAASADGRLLALGRRNIGRSKGNFIELIDSATGESAGSLKVERSFPLVIAFSDDGRRLAVGLVGEIQVWNLETKEMLSSIRSPGVSFSRITLSSDGRRLAGFGHASETVWLWDLAPFKELTPLRSGDGVRGLGFDPTGMKLLTVGSEGARVWEVQSR